MAKATKLPDPPKETVDAYLRAIAATPGAEAKENFGAPYTAVNGNMYSMLARRTGEVGIRLGKDDFAAYMAKYDKPFDSGPWTPPKEYVGVLDELLHDTGALSGWLAKSLAYASTLKPKPVKKKV